MKLHEYAPPRLPLFTSAVCQLRWSWQIAASAHPLGFVAKRRCDRPEAHTAVAERARRTGERGAQKAARAESPDERGALAIGDETRVAEEVGHGDEHVGGVALAHFG